MRFVLDSAGCFHWEDIIRKMDLNISFRSMNVQEKPFQDQVKKWIDTPDLRQYEKFVWDWHQFLLDVQEVFYQTEDADLIKNLNMYVLSRFIQNHMKKTEIFMSNFMNVLKKQKNF